MEKLILVCCLHGNERYGLSVCESQSLFPFVLANEKALKENKRFIDSDLNRVFPGNEEGNYEERRAAEILEKIKDFDYVLDLHSSSNRCPLFGIITKPNKEKIEFAKKLGLKKLIIMPESFASGKALIDFVKYGLSIEIGPHENLDNKKQVSALIENFAENKSYNEDIEVFEIFEIIRDKADEILIENFKEVKKGEKISENQIAEFDFVPVLVGEEAYKGTLCLAARRIEPDNLYKQAETIFDMAKKEEKKEHKEEFKVTPYEVSGNIDYHKLIKDFGLSELKEMPDIFNENVLFRRKTIFAHRDIQRVLEALRNKKKVVMMTGLMPTGRMHLGHMILAQQFVLYQKLGAKIYIAVADIEAYNARGQSLEDSRRIALEDYIPNYIALGLKPENCEIYFQSERSKNPAKANAYYRLQNLLSRYATFNEFKAVYGEITPGKMLAALLQASDMLHAQLPEFEGVCPVVVPVGVDQDVHIRLARDISQSIKEFNFNQLSSTYHFFLPGLGGGKMSSSDPTSFIALTDNAEEVKRKINKYAFSGGKDTIEEHRKLGGNPDVDVSFQYLKMFFENDDKKLAQIEKDYRSGKMLSGELKAYLIEKINAFLKEHQKKREEAKKNIDKFLIKS
jgi:tryptophanyl-tRNA synthetase